MTANSYHHHHHHHHANCNAFFLSIPLRSCHDINCNALLTVHRLATSSKDQSLGIWDVISGTQVSSIIPFTDIGTSGELRCLHTIQPATTPTAIPQLYTGNGSGALQLWKVDESGTAIQVAHVRFYRLCMAMTAHLLMMLIVITAFIDQRRS